MTRGAACVKQNICESLWSLEIPITRRDNWIAQWWNTGLAALRHLVRTPVMMDSRCHYKELTLILGKSKMQASL